MISQKFKKLYEKLNPEQRLAVDTIEGPVMVIAGPGTGKTQILTLRIANILLKTQVNPENILALTFSESASFEMRQRLLEMIGSSAFRVDISTFHSFSNEIIKNYPDEFPKLLSSENITEVEQIELVEKLINSLELKILRPYGDALYYLKDIISAINDLKKESVGPSDLREAIFKQRKEFEQIEDLHHGKGIYKGVMKGKYQELQKNIEKSEELFKVFESYEKVLEKEKKYDYNDMLLEVIKVIEKNKSLLLRIQEKYQYILIDEHQDTNAAQNKLVEHIASFFEIPNLFVVGDERQAIYRFQGASLENFLYFKKLYPKAKLINLERNYRSYQLILDAASSMIEKNISANILPQKKLKSAHAKKTQKIKIAALSEYHSEYEFVAQDIQNLIKSGTDPAEIAVFARRNMDLLEMVQPLQRRQIKFSIQSDQDIFSDLQIQKLIMIFQAIENFGDDVTFVRALHVDFLKIDPLDIYKILNYSRKKKIDIYSAIPLITKKRAKEIGLENLQTILDFFVKFKRWVLLNKNIPFDDFFVKIINESGMREYFLKTQERLETLNKLTALFDEIKLRLYKNPQFNLPDFLKLLETVKKHKVILKSKMEKNVQEDGIRLLTAHKAKGQEFDFVYIINCFDSRWGNSRKRGVKIKIPWEFLGADKKSAVSFEEIEDERRLFYVGLTRARKGIVLTYSKSGIDGREQLPSQFLEEINPKLIEMVNTLKFEKSFDKKVLFEQPQKSGFEPKNKEYFSKLFLEKGLSVTGLENFLECPWKYFFRNLLVLPDVKDKHLVFGTAIHSVLDLFIKSGKIKKLTEDFLVVKFKEIIDEQALPEHDSKELFEKGEKALRAFYKQIIPGWPKDVVSEMVIKGVKLTDKIILNGRIDMVEPISNKGLVRVHDFKTGKPKSRSQIDGSKENGEYNYLRQLTFYKILLDKYREGLFKMREGIIDFVEPDEKGRFHSEVFVINNDLVKTLENQIKEVGDQIINLKFWNDSCGQKDCEYCKLRVMAFGDFEK